MIYIIIGTRGQFIKMFPVMKLLDKEKINYKFIYTSQHFNIMGSTREKLKVKQPDVNLAYKKKDLVNILGVIMWALRVLLNARKLSIRREDYILIHGNTETSLLSLLIAKFFHAKAVHIEAGWRSGKLFDPFPEEIISAIIGKFSDIYFCSYKEDLRNIPQKKEAYVVNGNTVFDAIEAVLKISPSSRVKKIIKNKFVVFSIRRMETLYSRKNLEAAISILEQILLRNFYVVWPVHEVTRYSLEKKDLWQRVEKLKAMYNLEITDYFDYIDFMHLFKNSEFVASDGGGPQSETYYLSKPMLVLRKITENEPGMNETAYLSNIDVEKAMYFLNHYKEFKREENIKGSPSENIVNYFKRKYEN